MRQRGKSDRRLARIGATGQRAGGSLRCVARLLLAAAGAGAALAAAACGDRPRTAQAICRDLEAAGVAAGCHDTSKTACKYARERVTFYLPGGGEKTGGQVLRFSNEAQYDLMMRMIRPSKTGAILEAKSALTLVHFLSDRPEATAKAKAVVEKLPPVPSSQAPDPTCAK